MRSGRKHSSSPAPPSTPKGRRRRCAGSSCSMRCASRGIERASAISTGRPLRCSRRRFPVSISAGRVSRMPSRSNVSSMFQRKRICRRLRKSSISASMQVAARGRKRAGPLPANAAQPPQIAAATQMQTAASRTRPGRQRPVSSMAAMRQERISPGQRRSHPRQVPNR